MRLIDKDRLLKSSNHYWLEMENFGDIESIDVRFVEMAEEVKAIPIEWFEWLLDTMGDGMYNLRAVIKDWERYKEDWEKENETDRR